MLKYDNFINEKLNDKIWYHGTPDAREIFKNGFKNREISVEICDDYKRYQELQDEMNRIINIDKDKYFKLLDEVPSTKKRITYKEPIFLTNDKKVALTYADAHRSYDFQNAESHVFTCKTLPGKTLTIDGDFERFRGINIETVKLSLKKDGISIDKIEEVFNTYKFRNTNNKLSTVELGVIAKNLGYEIVDVTNVYDSYNGGSIASTVRMVFDPNMIEII